MPNKYNIKQTFYGYDCMVMHGSCCVAAVAPHERWNLYQFHLLLPFGGDGRHTALASNDDSFEVDDV